MGFSLFLNNLADYVTDISRDMDVPAISVAVWYRDHLYRAAHGQLNRNTQVEATTDAIFQIGSISKVMTASLVMQLVEEGRVQLEAPVKRYLPDFQVADPTLTERITVGQLLDHTSGLAGDFLGSTSHTEVNAIARYVDRCALLPAIHPPGEHYSYSNAAYNIAGRLIEVVLGTTWFDAVETRIFRPLGMRHSIAHPAQVLKYRAAMGHVREQSGQLTVASQCYLPMGWAPCGATIMTSATDLITFARAHLNHGTTDSGQPWLSPRSVELMQTERIALSQHRDDLYRAWGIGWGLNGDGRTPVVAHSGRTVGQTARLILLPEQNAAFSVLYNSDQDQPQKTITKTLLKELAGLDFVEEEPGATALALERLQSLIGRYRVLRTTVDVSVHEGTLTATVDPDNGWMPIERYALKPLGENSFASYSPGGERGPDIMFPQPDENGRPAYLSARLRLIPRV